MDLIASPCYTTNSNKHDKRKRERERETETYRLTDRQR